MKRSWRFEAVVLAPVLLGAAACATEEYVDNAKAEVIAEVRETRAYVMVLQEWLKTIPVNVNPILPDENDLTAPPEPPGGWPD